MTILRPNGLDADLAAMLAAGASTAFPPARERTPEQIRRSLDELVASLGGPGFEPERVGSVDDVPVELADRQIPVRVYQPLGRLSESTVVYFHGGGFVAGSVDTHDKTTRRLCNATGARVVSVDYRLAPEHPYPAGPDDCYDATVWAGQRFAGQPLVIAGDSAGGAMVAAVALRARDEDGPRIDGQVLVYPALDPKLASSSTAEFAQGYVLTRDDMATYWEHYLAGVEPTFGYADLAAVDDLRHLPPAVVVTAGFDPLRDEGADFAGRLARCHVPVAFRPEPALIHGWLDMATTVPAAAAARDRLTASIGALIARARETRPGT